MASSVFYRFKNSKDAERVTFDGTGISVFELKRAIIAVSTAGGTDFDLHLYTEDNSAQYDDDTTVIPRSTTVVAVRRPPAAKGMGRAARYITGKAPVHALKKTEIAKPQASSSEADAEAAFLAESEAVWDQQKATMAHAKPVFHKKKPVNVPTHDPPPGYVCYRCQKKGHWIQACPTNDDPDFKPPVRAKRTTGIPRSRLKVVSPTANDGDSDEQKNILLDAEGQQVQILTDEAAWQKFQETAVRTKAKAANVDAQNKELRDLGLECSLDNQKFVNPMKTPCCGKTYCHDCIDNALAEGDLICPNCKSEGILIDDLVADEEMVEKVRKFDAEKAKEKNNHAPVPNNESISQAPTPTPNLEAPKPSVSTSSTDTPSLKRKESPGDIQPPTAPKAMRQTGPDPNFISTMAAISQSMPNPSPMGMAMGPMGMSGPGGFNGMNAFMGGPGFVPNGPMGMNSGFNGQNGWNPYNAPQWNQNMGQMQGGWGGNNGNWGAGPYQGFQQNFQQNQQPGLQHHLGENQMGDDAYERRPVNPNRANNRRKPRAPDVHYL